MKYSNQVIINLPIKQVIELFDSEENLFKWQPELLSFEHLSGEKGEVGAKSRMKYKMGKREIDMVETITIKNFPKEFSGTYEAKGVWNEMRNYFEEIDACIIHLNRPTLLQSPCMTHKPTCLHHHLARSNQSTET